MLSSNDRLPPASAPSPWLHSLRGGGRLPGVAACWAISAVLGVWTPDVGTGKDRRTPDPGFVDQVSTDAGGSAARGANVAAI